MATTTAADVFALTGRLPGAIPPERGEQLYAFVRERRPTSCLELGVAHGVSTLYIAAALAANGAGTLTAVDRVSARNRQPLAGDLIEAAGLSDRVELVYHDTSYTWFLHDRLRDQLVDEGTIEPCYDFVFIDGAHTWDVDALAFGLVDRLLRGGGWILFDDLDWKLDAHRSSAPAQQRELAQVNEVWELLVVADPGYDVLRCDGQWGWARKAELPAPASRLLVRRDLVGGAFAVARTARARWRARNRVS